MVPALIGDRRSKGDAARLRVAHHGTTTRALGMAVMLAATR
jgi:hypothetical protein